MQLGQGSPSRCFSASTGGFQGAARLSHFLSLSWPSWCRARDANLHLLPPCATTLITASWRIRSHLSLLTHRCSYLGHCTLIYRRASSFNPQRGANLLPLQGRDGSGQIAWDRLPWSRVTRRLGFSSRAHVANPSLPLPNGSTMGIS